MPKTESERACLKRWRAKHKEHIAAWFREYRKLRKLRPDIDESYKEKARIRSAKRFSRIMFDGNDVIAIERDGYKCLDCGRSDNFGKRLCVHHLDETGQTDSPNNSLDNLVTLCHSCHAKRHHPKGYTFRNKEKISSA